MHNWITNGGNRDENGGERRGPDSPTASVISILMQGACGDKISMINLVTVPDVRSHYIFQMSEFEITSLCLINLMKVESVPLL